jgi:uncharacterized membrane-anchored protein
MDTITGPGFEQYPERADIQAEAHARPPLAIESETAEVWNWVLHDLPEAGEAWQAPYDPSSRHKVQDLEGGQLRIERHTEFVSITWLGAGPPDQDALRVIRLCPGRQLAGARVLIRPAGWDGLADVFGTGRIFGGAARFAGVEVATDFQVGKDQMVTYTLSGAFEDAFARGRLVKRLVDLETYRMAALLGLPAVRQTMPALQALEERAGAAMSALSSAGDDALGASIREISSLLAEVGALREGLRYRMAASRAYYDIVSDRLASLAETSIGQRQTLKGFVDHRLAPAIKTIAAFDRRISDVSATLTEAMALARTRLEQASQEYNQALLVSMEKRARQQVHLGQAVEGLSVAAISYYVVGLIGVLIKSLPHLAISAPVMQAISVPLVIALVWYNVRRAKAHIENV